MEAHDVDCEHFEERTEGVYSGRVIGEVAGGQQEFGDNTEGIK